MAMFFSVILSFGVQANESGKYTELDWPDLVPADWQPDIIQPDPSEEHHVDKKSLVAKLQNKTVKLPGFMRPVKFSGRSVSEFVLVPFLDHHVKVHVHHEPNQMIYVFLAKPLEVTNPFQPIWVSGEMKLESVETDEGHTGYTLHNAKTESYIY
ncbi:MAG: DUF3299 domain-containing protein [Pseudomonadales bacterium]|nr:DUF3299 domain-containing protein [Pseudomonadales bacterium]